jgi:hypothetical protein
LDDFWLICCDSLVELLCRLVIAWFIVWFDGRFAGSLFDFLYNLAMPITVVAQSKA